MVFYLNPSSTAISIWEKKTFLGLSNKKFKSTNHEKSCFDNFLNDFFIFSKKAIFADFYFLIFKHKIR